MLPDEAPTRSRTLLLADDDERIRRSLGRLLVMHGWTVILASDGLEAVASFRAEADSICCALLDVHMPGQDGIAAATQIRAQAPTLPIILFSGEDAASIAIRTDQLQLHAVLQKPVPFAEMAAVLQAALDNPPTSTLSL